MIYEETKTKTKVKTKSNTKKTERWHRHASRDLFLLPPKKENGQVPMEMGMKMKTDMKMETRRK